MSSFVPRNIALARESSWFKVEQEADIQKHARRLVSQGKIEEIAAAYLAPRRHQTFAESIRAFEVVPEVLQAQARVDDPGAAARKEFVRKVKAKMPELSAEEVLRYRSSVYGIAATAAFVPQVHLGKNKWALAWEAAHELSKKEGLPPTPAQREAARAVAATGYRSIAYGSALGIAALVVSMAATARLLDIGSMEELRSRAQQPNEALAATLRSYLAPVKGRIQSFFAPYAAGGAELDNELQRRLVQKYNQSRAAVVQPQHPSLIISEH